MRNRIIGSMIPALATLSLCTYSCIAAYAYEAPSNIELSIGTVEINKEALHGDTIVEVPVYLQNNPGLLSLRLVIALDNGIGFEKYYEVNAAVDSISNINIYECTGTEQVISADIMSKGQGKFYDNGQIVNLRIAIPENAASGRYSIRFANGYDDRYIEVLVGNSFDALFGVECFSKLEEGAVIIKEPDITVPPPQEPVYEPSEQDTDSHLHQNEQTETTKDITPSETTVISTSVSEKTTTSTTVTSKKVEILEEIDDISETDLVTELTSTVSTSAANAEAAADKKQSEERTSKKFLIPAIIAAVIAAVAAVGFIVKKKSGNNNE